MAAMYGGRRRSGVGHGDRLGLGFDPEKRGKWNGEREKEQVGVVVVLFSSRVSRQHEAKGGMAAQCGHCRHSGEDDASVLPAQHDR